MIFTLGITLIAWSFLMSQQAKRSGASALTMIAGTFTAFGSLMWFAWSNFP